MVHSNSSLNAFNQCRRLFKLSCIDKLEPDSPKPDFQFGVIGHKVLYHAGMCHDAVRGFTNAYEEIPGELEYPELKEKYGIRSWYDYFVSVIDACTNCVNDALNNYIIPYVDYDKGEQLYLEREKTVIANVADTASMPMMKGILDFLAYTKDRALILDYKFSSHRKTQSDFDENSQLQIYAYLVSQEYNIPVNNITIGYIDIPKVSYDMPALLKNGTLSKSKSQNVSADNYKIAIEAAHGANDPYYNAEPGGYYYDIVQELSLNKPAYMSVRMLDYSVYSNIMKDVLETIQLIETTADLNLYPRQYSSYTCAGCEYRKTCKPWLSVEE